ncbi:hypothetical protein HDU91_006409, partial [Kappamyces sp. JEL0680]
MKPIQNPTTRPASRFSSQNNSTVNLFKTCQSYLERFLEHALVRRLRRIVLSARWDLTLAVIFYLASTIALLVCTKGVANYELPSINVYNGIHILANVLGHVFLVSVLALCTVMHKVITAVQLCVSGVTVNEVDGSSFGRSPGFYFRIFLVVLALGIDTVL